MERDFRTLPPATQAELRRVAVNMVRSGARRIEVAAAVGVNRRFVGEWVRAFAAGGEAALAGAVAGPPSKRRSRPGRKP